MREIDVKSNNNQSNENKNKIWNRKILANTLETTSRISELIQQKKGEEGWRGALRRVKELE